MYGLLQSLSTQFANSQNIIDKVGDRCDFVLDPQNAKELPLITYNAFEVAQITKDNIREYEMSIVIMSSSVQELLEIYDTCRNVMDTETTDFYSEFLGSSEVYLSEQKDDVFIISQEYKIEYKQ